MAFTVFVALDERVGIEVSVDLCRPGRRADGSPNRTRRGVLAMLHFMRRSLLVQLLSVYLLFVVVVLIGGVGVNMVVAQKLRNDVQASDQALAQEIAVETSLHLSDSESSLAKLGTLAVQADTHAAIVSLFQAFEAARNDVDQVYWLDSVGALVVSCPPLPGKCQDKLTAEFSPQGVIQRALAEPGPVFEPVFEVGAVVEPTFNAGVIIAYPAHARGGKRVGFVAASFSLAKLSDPLEAVVNAQRDQGRRLMISIIDDAGKLIATPHHKQLLFKGLNELPGGDQALQGHAGSPPGLG